MTYGDRIIRGLGDSRTGTYLQVSTGDYVCLIAITEDDGTTIFREIGRITEAVDGDFRKRAVAELWSRFIGQVMAEQPTKLNPPETEPW